VDFTRCLLLVAAVLGSSMSVAAHAQSAARIALIVGNSDYQNAPRLANPVNDATDVAAAFTRLGFSVQLVKNGTFDVMRRGLLAFAQQAQAADIAVVYFAGHGMEIRDENWLIPVDAELRMDFSASQEAVSLGSIIPIASRARKLGLVILDACRENPFSRQIQMSQPGRALPSRGFAPVEPHGSVLVAFAAKHGTTADDGSGRNSPFTRALLHHLETPGLEINYLFRNIHDEVTSATQQRQEPYIYGTLSKDPIYLVERPTPATAAPAGNDAAHAWDSVKDTRNPALLEAFVKHYGDSFYADLARSRLVEIRPAETASAAPPPPEKAAPRTELPTAPPEGAKQAEPPKAADKTVEAHAGEAGARESANSRAANSRRIVVTSATLGANCGVPRGNVTSKVAKICNGREVCSLPGSRVSHPDPAFGCAKAFSAQWKCSENGETKSAAVARIAFETNVLTLSCE
jgi:hypothetical protein